MARNLKNLMLKTEFEYSERTKFGLCKMREKQKLQSVFQSELNKNQRVVTKHCVPLKSFLVGGLGFKN